MTSLSQVKVAVVAALAMAAFPACSGMHRHRQEMKEECCMRMPEQHASTVKSIADTKAVVADAQKSGDAKKMKDALARAQGELQAIEDRMERCRARMGGADERSAYRCGCA